MSVTPPPEAGPGAAVARRVPRWMWIVLVLSVAINLVVAGMAIATALHFRHGQGGPMSRFARYVETLPEARRGDLRKMLDEHRSKIRPLRRALRQARRRARDAFTAEPFQRDALAQANGEVADARIALTKIRQALFPRLAEMLTVEERREFLKRFHRRGKHRWRRRD